MKTEVVVAAPDEDHPWIDQVLRALGYAGRFCRPWEVVACCSSSRPPQAVLVDIWLGDESGTELCRTLKEIGFAGPCLVLSGALTEPVVVQELQLALVPRPFGTLDFKRALESLQVPSS